MIYLAYLDFHELLLDGLLLGGGLAGVLVRVQLQRQLLVRLFDVVFRRELARRQTQALVPSEGVTVKQSQKNDNNPSKRESSECVSGCVSE